MGGERSCTTRMRLRGQICAICSLPLPGPHSPGEKLCHRCQPAKVHRVYMSFMLRGGWYCQFLEEDLKTPLPRKLNISSPEKLFDLAERGGCVMNLEERQAIEHGIHTGRGGFWLQLTEEQYRRLRMP
jgi:hypothetical protein